MALLGVILVHPSRMREVTRYARCPLTNASLTRCNNAGMSMFSTKDGLYERARKKFKIQDGIRLFSYPFYKQRRADVQAFFAQVSGLFFHT